jgi:hypothetical protein
MNNSSTNLQTKSISRAFPISLSLALQIVLLILVGFTATWLHARFRFPLNLPGRHGLEFMLLIMGARYASSLRLSATVAVTGSILASLIPVLGFKDPMLPYIYLGIGGFIDFAWYRWSAFRNWIPLAALLGGLAYGLIPFVRLIFLLLSAYPYNSFAKHGYLIPFLTHITFGFVGAFAGVGLMSEIKKRVSKKKSN